MKKILKEPLVHFILLGILIFMIYAFVGKQEDSENTIVFDTYDLDNIMSSWELQWKRPPTPEELSNLINQNIKQEIFYQEALVMNLDHNDEIIKRRLAQKMQFLTKDLASLSTPTDAQIEAYFKENESKYMLPPKYTLYQIVFSSDHRDNPEQDAQNTLNQFNSASFDIMESKGDKLPFKYYYRNAYSDDLSTQFGSTFVNGLTEIITGEWTGPVLSSFGYHLVYIEKYQEPVLPPLVTIKDKVLVDYTYEQESLMDELVFNELKNKYSVEFDLDEKLIDPETKNVVENALK